MGFKSGDALGGLVPDRRPPEPPLLLAALEAFPDGVFFQGADGRTAHYNERLLAMWGVDAAVPAKATLEERLAAVQGRFEDPDAFSRLARELEGERDRALRVDVRVKGGQVFECNTAPVLAADGTYLGRLWSYRDVTAQRTTEAELAQARTLVLEREKLALVGTLVSGVAHEIRTPLTYVGNHAFLLRRAVERLRAAGVAREEDLAEIESSATAVLEGSERIGRLVGQLRRFARRPDEAPRSVDVDDAVRGAVLLFEATRRGRVLVEASLESDVRVVADEGAIEQVVLNLLENAADASPPGGRVRVSSASVPGGCEIVVADEGSGIPAELQGRVYEPFFTTKPEGLGLGLAIVRRIVESSGGRLACKSAPGEGSAFTVFLPTP